MKFVEFEKKINLVESNFSFKYPAELLMMIYTQCSELPDEKINKGFDRILGMTAEEWNKKFGYGGKPTIADWKIYFTGQVRMSPEDQATVEVAKILDFAKYYSGGDVLFDNPTTNACAESYGGLAKLHFQLFDNFNPKPLQRTWVARELGNLWVSFYSSGRSKSDPIPGKQLPPVYHNGEFHERKNRLILVGDKEKCQMLLASKEQQKQLES